MISYTHLQVCLTMVMSLLSLFTHQCLDFAFAGALNPTHTFLSRWSLGHIFLFILWECHICIECILIISSTHSSMNAPFTSPPNFMSTPLSYYCYFIPHRVQISAAPGTRVGGQPPLEHGQFSLRGYQLPITLSSVRPHETLPRLWFQISRI